MYRIILVCLIHVASIIAQQDVYQPITGLNFVQINNDGSPGHAVLEISRENKRLEAYMLNKNVYQPFTDELFIEFYAFDRHFLYSLHITRNLFDNDETQVIVSDNEKEVIEPMEHVSYHSKHVEGEHKGWASVTIHPDGELHGLFYVEEENEMFQLDHVDRLLRYHELSDDHEDILNKHATKHGKLAIRKISQEIKEGEASCGGYVDPNDSGRKLLGMEDHKHDAFDLSHFGLNLGGQSGRKLNGVATRWTGCYASDNVARAFEIGVATDYAMFRTYGSTSAIRAQVQELIADTNLIYANQLNIHITVKTLYMKTSGGGESWNDASSTCMPINERLSNFKSWQNKGKPNHGLWHILSTCYSCGTVGMAFVGTVCGKGSNTAVSGVGRCSGWRTVAHELGHNFNAKHSFEEGKGQTGGIMDYGNGLLNGIYQFNTKYRKSEVCQEISANIDCFAFKPLQAKCGNGIVEPHNGEECEGTSACCSNCRRVGQCGGGECCTSDCKFKSPSQTCKSGTGICMEGKCSDNTICKLYSLKFCGTQQNYGGCRVKCHYGGYCNDINNLVDAGTREPINRLPDNTKCGNGLTTTGKCKAGVCVESDGNATTPTKRPTPRPTPRPTQATKQYEWVIESPSLYTSCSDTCGGGTQTLKKGNAEICIEIGANYRKYVDYRYCEIYNAKNTKPRATRPCNTKACQIVWYIGSWSSCYCDSQTQRRTVYCAERKNGSYVRIADSKCSSSKPGSSKSCTAASCFSWKTGEYGECSVRCGTGTKSRIVSCINTSTRVTVSNSNCDGSKKPSTQTTCRKESCPSSPPTTVSYLWSTGQWSSCRAANSGGCGNGIQTRNVVCLNTSNGRSVSDSNCPGHKRPNSIKSCSNGVKHCPIYRFKVTSWSSCTKSCNTGYKTRSVYCYDAANDPKANVKLNNSYCTSIGLPVPFNRKTCRYGTCPYERPGCYSQGCNAYWHTTRWSTCSSTCGMGKRQRTVTCRDKTNNNILPEKYCKQRRPNPIAVCNSKVCPYYKVSSWGECSAGCGAGYHYRNVRCVNSARRTVDSANCRNAPKPPYRTPCNNGACGLWSAGYWDGCGSSCTSVESVERRKVDCLVTADALSAPTMDMINSISDTESSLVAMGVCPVSNAPGESQPCSDVPICEGDFKWVVKSWSGCFPNNCNVNDLPTEEYRQVECVSLINSSVVSDDACIGNQMIKPIEKRACPAIENFESICPKYNWFVLNEGLPTEYGECSSNCDGGQQARLVVCVDEAYVDTETNVIKQFVEQSNIVPEDPELSLFVDSHAKLKIVDDSFCTMNNLPRPSRVRECVSNKCENEGACVDKICECPPGFSGTLCEVSPFTSLTDFSVSLVETETETDSNVAVVVRNDGLDVKWINVNDTVFDALDIFITLGSRTLPIPISSVERVYTADEEYSFTLPDSIQIKEKEEFQVLLWLNSTLSSTSTPIVLEDPCMYTSCGEHGTCNGFGECDCVDGFSGALCEVSPCEAAKCDESFDGVDKCNVVVDDKGVTTVECKCNEGYSGSMCKHESFPGCDSYCENDSFLSVIKLDRNLLYNGVKRFINEDLITEDSDLGNLESGSTECDIDRVTCTCNNYWTGPKCNICPLQCMHDGIQQPDCSSCMCKPGYHGESCECRYIQLQLQLDYDVDTLSEFESLEDVAAVFDHDVVKSLLSLIPDDMPRADNVLDNIVVYPQQGKSIIEFELRSPCATLSSYDTHVRRLKELTGEEEDLLLVYNTLYKQTKSQWSPLRSTGVLTSSFDTEHGIRAFDPAGVLELDSDGDFVEIKQKFSPLFLAGICGAAVASIGAVALGVKHKRKNRRQANEVNETLEMNKLQAMMNNDWRHRFGNVLSTRFSMSPGGRIGSLRPQRSNKGNSPKASQTVPQGPATYE